MTVLLLPVNIMFQYLRWRTIIKCSVKDIDNKSIIFSILSGIAIGSITPGKVGELGKSLFIKEIEKSKLLFYAIFEKGYNFVIILFFGLISTFYYFTLQYSVSVSIYYVLLLVVFIVNTILFMFLIKPVKYLKKKKLQTVIRKFKPISNIRFNFKNLEQSKFFIISLFTFFTYSFQFVLIILAFENFNILKVISGVFIITLFKTLVPISIADLGIQETISIFTLSLIGISETSAFNASILIFIINIFLPSILGLYFILSKR